jgi:ATP-dependent Clp protease ATP-binding subunit ClpA
VIDVGGLGDEAREAVARAEDEARELGLERVGTEHLLLGILGGQSTAGRALSAAGATMAAARHKAAETAGGGRSAPTDGPVEPTPRAARAIGRSHRFSHHDRAEAVGADHLLLGVLDVEGNAGQVLRGIGVDVAALRESLTAPAAEARPTARATDLAACPRCGVDVDELTFRIVRATDADGRGGDAVVFSCRACGVVLGVTRARESDVGKH